MQASWGEPWAAVCPLARRLDGVPLVLEVQVWAKEGRIEEAEDCGGWRTAEEGFIGGEEGQLIWKRCSCCMASGF